MYKSLRAQTLHYFARPQERILTEPLSTPAAWLGSDMRKRDDWSVRLSPAEVAELDAAVKKAQASGRGLGTLTKNEFPLPVLSRRIADWQKEIRHGRGFVLIRGVPVQDW